MHLTLAMAVCRLSSTRWHPCSRLCAHPLLAALVGQSVALAADPGWLSCDGFAPCREAQLGGPMQQFFDSTTEQLERPEVALSAPSGQMAALAKAMVDTSSALGSLCSSIS